MDSQGRSNRAAWVSILPAGILLLILSIVMVANRESNVWAIPTRPDPCAPVHPTTWPGGAVNRDLVQHQHRTADNLRFVNPHYKTYSAWDNSNYRYSAVGNARLADFGHGFMERPVKYKFVFGSMAFPA